MAHDPIKALQRHYADERVKHPRTFGDVLRSIFGTPGTARIVPTEQHSRETVTRYTQGEMKRGTNHEDWG